MLWQTCFDRAQCDLFTFLAGAPFHRELTARLLALSIELSGHSDETALCHSTCLMNQLANRWLSFSVQTTPPELTISRWWSYSSMASQLRNQVSGHQSATGFSSIWCSNLAPRRAKEPRWRATGGVSRRSSCGLCIPVQMRLFVVSFRVSCYCGGTS